MFCYRRFGHNEGDEPSFTQPLMYSKIRSHKTTLEIYSERLIGEGLVTADEIDKMKADWRAYLEAEFEAGQDFRPNKADWLDGQWKDLKRAEVDGPRRGDTGVAIDRAGARSARALTQVPRSFNVHKTVKRFIDNRLAAIEIGEGIDWATGEALAFGTLLDEGIRSGCPARTSSAAPSASATRCSTTRRPSEAYTPLNNIVAAARRATRSSTRCSRKRRCSASNTAIRWPSRRR